MRARRIKSTQATSESRSLSRWAWKLRALRAYGGACVCCGETEPVFLTFDHIGGGGAAHRRADWKVEKHIGRWLLDHACPPGFRILCWNCHKAIDQGPRHLQRMCPHEWRRQGVSDQELWRRMYRTEQGWTRSAIKPLLEGAE